jgi:diguanylate cyclase (GGDEF)-like protein/PAS domain S-box-containing protein
MVSLITLFPKDGTTLFREAWQLIKTPTKTVLLVEDNPEDAQSIGGMFDHQGFYSFELEHEKCLEDAENYLGGHAVDVVLLGMGLPGSPGLQAVKRIHAAAPRAAVVLLAADEDEAAATEAVHGEAQDYLVKGQIEAHELMRSLLNAIQRKVIEESLFQANERAQVMLDCVGDAVICTDPQGNIAFLNPIAERMTGWPLAEAVGRPLTEAFRIMDAGAHEPAARPPAAATSQVPAVPAPSNFILVRRDGNEVFIEDSVAPMHDSQGLAAGSVLVFRDQTAARALASQIARLAERDSLTGLPNRSMLNNRIGRAIERARDQNTLVAILFLDLDGFKNINDSLGHSVGDLLLQSVAKRLEESVRTPDTVSRQGGDEFVILLQDVQSIDDIAIAVRRLLKSVSKTHFLGCRDLHVTASIGVSVYPNDGLDAETLIQHADTAMYQAKQAGRQSYKFFTPEMNIRAVERQSIEEHLRRALERAEFTLHYQPKINVKTKAITGAEALIRWTHPTLGPVPPARFIPVAEDTGLILPIGAWALREACKQARAWEHSHLRVSTVAVNVSAIQFRSEGFLGSLLATVSESDLDPESLELEVTESALMERVEHTAPLLRILRERGIKVAVDDFGTGYSSLSYLRRLPLDALKIDQSFFREIASAPGDPTMLSAIVSMGRSLRLRVIAEGIETAEDMEFLTAHDCDEAQGYYLSPPVPPEEFARMVEARA